MSLLKDKIMYSVSILLILVSCGKNASQIGNTASTRVYPVQTISKQSATLQISYPATIRGEEDAEIKPRVNGYIDKVYIDEGDVVKKGDPLFSINSPTSAQDLASANALLETANANLNTARLNVERMRPLAEKNIVSDVQLQTYENAFKTAEANQKNAEATLRTAQATTGWTTVTSPIDGVVGSIAYRSGNLVTSATTLTTISKTNVVYAYFSLNEKALLELFKTLEGNTQQEKIKQIPDVTLILPDGTIYADKGHITAISGAVNTQTGSVSLRASFPNKEGLLRSGSSCKIAIPRELSDVFVIPQKATFAQQDKIVLYKVIKDQSGESDSTVQTIVSVLPLPDGKNYAITAGLTAGDRVILDGVATLRNAIKIKTKVAEEE